MSIENLYLLVYFLSYSAAIGCLAICLLSRLKRRTRKLLRYSMWVIASIFFLLFRNICFFLKEFREINTIETSLAFYVFYILTMAFFLGSLTWVALGYSFSGHFAAVNRAAFATAVMPLMFLPILICLECGIPNQTLRLNLINIVMYFSYFAVLAVIVTLAVRVRKITNAFDRLFCKTNVLSSCSYVVLAVSQWYFGYRGQIYELNPVCIVNLVLFLMFSSSAFVVGRETLSRKDGPTETDVAMINPLDVLGEKSSLPNCNKEESLIISLISQGATNQEISEILGVSISRVKNAIYRIFVRFGVKSRTELISYFDNVSSLTQASDHIEQMLAGIIPRAQPGS